MSGGVIPKARPSCAEQRFADALPMPSRYCTIARQPALSGLWVECVTTARRRALWAPRRRVLQTRASRHLRPPPRRRPLSRVTAHDVSLVSSALIDDVPTLRSTCCSAWCGVQVACVRGTIPRMFHPLGGQVWYGMLSLCNEPNQPACAFTHAPSGIQSVAMMLSLSP